ncbi:VTC domain-containing protein [Ruminococcaceae bacterium YRB3002]|nr:VTC domain-containing protein [Ruminococcaceae bacterium YRB3002]
MTYQNTFKRYEIKFILTGAQRQMLVEAMDGIMKIDKYGKTTIRNIYFDTPDYRIIRTSLDKPVYKEKLRVRSYRRVTDEDEVFVELKKKYDQIVYKRRIAVPEYEAMDWLAAGGEKPRGGWSRQIEDEIDYFMQFYEGLMPQVFLSYEREAYYPAGAEDGDIRITLDSNIIARDRDLSLRSGVYGTNIIDRDLTVLEVKVPGALPMWLIRFLRENDIHKTSFSKYGTYYVTEVMGKHDKDRENNGGLLYA